MANNKLTLFLPSERGNNLYIAVLRDDDAVWYLTTPAFEAYDTAHKANYGTALTEVGGSNKSGIFTVAFPSAIPAGHYRIPAYKRAGGSQDIETDNGVGGGECYWNGTDIISQSGDCFAVVASGVHGNAALKTLVDDVPTVAEFEARTLVAANYFDPAADTVANVTNLTNAPTNGDFTATMKTSAQTAAAAALAAYDPPTNAEMTAGFDALNQSASRRIMLKTSAQWERPDSSTEPYRIEVRTYTGDGALVNADSDPTLTVTGVESGSLAANLSAVSNPSTGVYRWTYNQPSNATIEQVQIDVSATIGGSAFTESAFVVSCDFVAATFTATDRANIEAILDDTGTAGVVVAAASKTGYALSSAGVQAIWDALTSALSAAGSIGKYLVDQLANAVPSAANIWAAGTRTLTASTNITLAKGTGVTGFNDLSSADVTAAVPTALQIATAVDTATAVYTAAVKLVRDDANTRDVYEVTFRKNGSLATIVGTPTINVKNESNANLIATSNLTIVGASTWKYVATGAERVTVGVAYSAIVTASIDSGARGWTVPVGKDSTV